ncbi:hypothetical protein [Caudoviricetes sp.]|nr:hypothetical protein [Caudoviricetes sp.]
MKTMRDIYNNQDALTSILPAVRTTDVNGTGVDLRDFDGAMVNFHVGAPGITLDASNRIELKIEESDDDSTYTAVADVDTLGAVSGGVATGTAAILIANASASKCIQIGYRGNKRYIRAVVDMVGTHGTGTAISASVTRALPHVAKVR